MSDLLAKCDWHGDELRVELPQRPEVVTVLVGGKAMHFAPVTTDLAEEIRSKVEAWSEVAELEGTIECLKGLAEANYERCYTCEAMLDCDECLRADASHKELRGLQAENERLRELCRHLYACNQYCDREESDGGCSACSYQLLECDCGFEERLLELGIEVDV